MRLDSVLSSALLLSLRASAQFPPEPEGVTMLRSKFHENVTISFKEPGICETTPGVKSYSGYVHLPPGFLDDGEEYGEAQQYPINTFFWFFEARNKPAAEAPLAIWLNGGPGASSLIGLLRENGPCFVANDSATTYLNPWSWNNEANMLYIDQPAQVGFSYDVLTNATVRLSRSREDDIDGGTDYYEIVPTNFTTGDGEAAPPDFGKLVNLTAGVGTFGSQRADRGTANTTTRAAHALWHFAQTWFGEFPHYRPEHGRISLWAESYGGHYGPRFARFFQEMNEKIAGANTGAARATQEWEGAQYLHLDTLGIINGGIDVVTQMESFITFPSYNTYGLHIFDAALEGELWSNWSRPHGCKAQVSACADYLRDHDPAGLDLLARRRNISEVCTNTTEECAMAPWAAYMSQPYYRARGWFDIGHPKQDPFPPPHYLGYLRQAHVQAALGVPVNFTATSLPVNGAFTANDDHIRSGFLDDLAWLLDHHHNNTNFSPSSPTPFSVHLIYGDRDYAANWVGGEAASLAVPWARQAEFAERAGYARLLVPSKSYDEEEEEEEMMVAGLTRQLGRLSFTRVFQAGHMVPAYAPAAAHAIFARAVGGWDVATGKVPITNIGQPQPHPQPQLHRNDNDGDDNGEGEGEGGVGDGYRTHGPRNAWAWVSLEPPFPGPRCYVLEPGTCVPDVWERVRKGEVVVRDWFVVEGENGDEEGGEGAGGAEELLHKAVVDSGEDNSQVVIGEL
ncbi:hypothetical protein SLS62_000560 [Diatrype stigma]|uniref:Carboxypeptidase n=1 Tax=Diatrype stigma TaxID=117547 RepID=A0AAN9UXU0_9PEZI